MISFLRHPYFTFNHYDIINFFDLFSRKIKNLSLLFKLNIKFYQILLKKWLSSITFQMHLFPLKSRLFLSLKALSTSFTIIGEFFVQKL